jgi:hypothetical protein
MSLVAIGCHIRRRPRCSGCRIQVPAEIPRYRLQCLHLLAGMYGLPAGSTAQWVDWTILGSKAVSVAAGCTIVRPAARKFLLVSL